MRLIDADKYLEKVCTYKETGCGSCKLQTMCPKDAPTVKAIPVGWIEKWLKNIKNDKRYKSEYVELTQDVKQIEYKGTVVIRIPCISDMLADWEKENEQNKKNTSQID